MKAFVYVLPGEEYYVQEAALEEVGPMQTEAYDLIRMSYDDAVLEGLKIYKTVISLDNAEEIV